MQIFVTNNQKSKVIIDIKDRCSLLSENFKLLSVCLQDTSLTMIDGRQQSSCTCLRDITPGKKNVKFDEASVFQRSIEKLTFF